MSTGMSSIPKPWSRKNDGLELEGSSLLGSKGPLDFLLPSLVRATMVL